MQVVSCGVKQPELTVRAGVQKLKRDYRGRRHFLKERDKSY